MSIISLYSASLLVPSSWGTQSWVNGTSSQHQLDVTCWDVQTSHSIASDMISVGSQQLTVSTGKIISHHSVTTEPILQNHGVVHRCFVLFSNSSLHKRFFHLHSYRKGTTFLWKKTTTTTNNWFGKCDRTISFSFCMLHIRKVITVSHWVKQSSKWALLSSKSKRF